MRRGMKNDFILFPKDAFAMVAHLTRQNNIPFLDNWLEFVIFHSINEE